MHILQRKILELSKQIEISSLSLRMIAEKIGETHPQKVKHHLQQLMKQNLIMYKPSEPSIPVRQENETNIFVHVPILGSASAGPALVFAENSVEDYLIVSHSLLKKKTKIFALRVTGDSMNRALVGGQTIEDSDYVIVDSDYKSPKSGDCVISIIEGKANIKYYHIDRVNNQIVLMSLSSYQNRYPPIFIHPDDESTDYAISGKVIQVMKGPK